MTPATRALYDQLLATLQDCHQPMTTGEVACAAPALVEVYDGCVPVSYTHLDVYKRQIGHCARDIADATTLTEREVYLVVNQAGRWITQARWEAVAQAYDRLSMTPGHSVKARSIAAAAGLSLIHI